MWKQLWFAKCVCWIDLRHFIIILWIETEGVTLLFHYATHCITDFKNRVKGESDQFRGEVSLPAELTRISSKHKIIQLQKEPWCMRHIQIIALPILLLHILSMMKWQFSSVLLGRKKVTADGARRRVIYACFVGPHSALLVMSVHGHSVVFFFNVKNDVEKFNSHSK